MLISLNWLREFVEMPASIDPRGLAERFTITTAEVEGVEHVTRWPDGVRIAPGATVDASEQDDWIIEVDNKSITHRPDLWGHYGIAREIAAILGAKLRAYEVTPAEKLGDASPGAPGAVPIVIDDAAKCPRYSALVFTGLKDGMSPAAMQIRLARCGMRPISFLVDLTNYVMLELGQPMHAFDAAKLSQIEVATAAAGEKFRTLDNVERVLPNGTLMIQSGRKSVAIAGIMGGAATEVSAGTTQVLLESANFDAATIRRAAAAMSLRTEASARFEKSLDPNMTVTAIGRFDFLARKQIPGFGYGGKLSDCYPRPLVARPIDVDTGFAARFIGTTVPAERMAGILTALEFKVEQVGGKQRVTPPTFRATKDISIEADVIEEVARSVGYDKIEPALPRVTTRYLGQSEALRLERRTLETLCIGGNFFEVHGYIWYDDAWNARLGFEPGECITLRNPAAEGCARLRKTLVPGLLMAVERNRHSLSEFRLLEIGSVFGERGTEARRHEGTKDEVSAAQERHVGLAVAMAGAKAGDAVWSDVKRAVETWGRQVVDGDVTYDEATPGAAWEDAARLAAVKVDGRAVGRVSVVALACKQRIDERLRGWSIAVAELSLAGLAEREKARVKLERIPEHPRVKLDFSFVADARRKYVQIAEDLLAFEHELLCGLSYVGSFEGGAVPAGKRSFTVRAEIGRADRTLAEVDVQAFRAAFTAFLGKLGLELRA